MPTVLMVDKIKALPFKSFPLSSALFKTVSVNLKTVAVKIAGSFHNGVWN